MYYFNNRKCYSSYNETSSITHNSALSGGNITDDGGTIVTARGVCWSTSQNPTTEDNKTTDGTGTGSFTSSLTGLSSETIYYLRAYSTNSAGSGYGQQVILNTYSGTITDFDGNVYNTVIIGTQTWMAENLKVSHYPDGTTIQLVEDNSAWEKLNFADKAYCYYNNNSSNGDTYGALYTWAAAMNGANSSDANPSGVQGVCPDDWHLPSDTEWTQLTDYLGGESVAGGKLKETGTTHWNSPNNGATNESGFTAIPGGLRHAVLFLGLSTNALFRSSTEYSSSDVWDRSLRYDYSGVSRSNSDKTLGFSVRCVKDN